MADLDEISHNESYISRHWNGRLSLTRSFWLNLMGANFLSALALNFLATEFRTNPAGFSPFIIWLALAVSILVWVWGAVGVWASADRYTKKPDSGVWGNVASALVILQGLTLLTQVPSFLSSPHEQASGEVADESRRDLFEEIGQETQVLISKQSSEGVRGEDIDVQAAEILGEYALERMRLHTAQILRGIGSNESAAQITQATVLIPQNGTNFVVTRFYIAGVNHAVQFMSIKDGEMTRVLCQSSRGDISVALAGKCRNTLQKEIGFSISGT